MRVDALSIVSYISAKRTPVIILSCRQPFLSFPRLFRFYKNGSDDRDRP